ncbi:MAG: ATP-binding cassette domain-containing protein [Pseudomonadota bacterium]
MFSTLAPRPALSVTGVSHSFDARKALDDVSLEVAGGSFTALLGINGAGKTTLFNLVTRLFANRSGTIEVCGIDVRREPGGALARLGVVFQSRAIDPNLSVEQNFAYQGALYGIASDEARRRGKVLMERWGLADRMHDRVRALSGGQARRAEIAGALIHRPRLLLCDEATAGLDVAARRAIVDDVHALARDDGVGVLWATHLIDEIAPEDMVVMLHEGRVIATGPARNIAGKDDLASVFLAKTGAGAEALA